MQLNRMMMVMSTLGVLACATPAFAQDDVLTQEGADTQAEAYMATDATAVQATAEAVVEEPQYRAANLNSEYNDEGSYEAAPDESQMLVYDNPNNFEYDYAPETLEAKTSGMLIRGALSIPFMLNYGGGLTSAGAYLSTGIGVNLQFGYRSGGWSVYLEQDIQGAFVTDEIADSLEREFGATSHFVGGTYLMFGEHVSIGNGLLSFAEGLGAMYGAKMKLPTFMGISSDTAFALKASINFTYFILGQYGVGLGFDYMLALAISDGISVAHAFQPLLTYTMMF